MQYISRHKITAQNRINKDDKDDKLGEQRST